MWAMSFDVAVTPDAAQQAVLDRVAACDHGPLLVTGGPGTGKSTLAVELALRFLRAGGDSHHLLLLSPSRASSAALRDALEARWAAEPDGGSLTDQPSRSFASYAFWLLGEARRRGFLEFAARTPRLLSGAEQDREIAALLDSEHTAIDWRVTDPISGAVRIDLREAAATAGFRKEIRELFDRAAEYGVSPEELIAWGEQAASGAGPGVPAWLPAGRLYAEYLEQLGQRAPNAFDPAGLISRACDVLEDSPQLLHEEQDRLRLILVDDLQEANPNIYRLLRLIGAGRRVVACANPDVAVQGFRGARPDLLAHWTGTTGDRPAAAQHAEDAGQAEMPEEHDDGTVTLRGRRGSMRPDEGLPGRIPEVLALDGDHRLDEPVGEVYGRVVQRIGAVGDSRAHRGRWAQLATLAQQRLDALAEDQRAEAERRAAAGEKPSSGRRLNVASDVDARGRGVHVAVVGGQYHAEQMILQEVLDRHHRGGDAGEPLPLDEIAVVVRNGQMVQQITRLFHSHGVPVRRSMSEIVLHEEVAVAPLLRILRAVTAEDPLTGADAKRLLAGPYGAVDSVALRRIRQRLLTAERRLRAETVDQRDSEELLAVGISAPEDPTVAEALATKDPALAGLRRLGAMVAAARTAWEQLGESAGAGDLLWEVWQASGREALWVRRSTRGGEEARRAHRDLDAVVSLFQAAERYAEQLPGHSISGFVTHMEEMELPMDTLAEASTAQDAVHVLTPATAAGQEFDTVVIAGLQDGVWPNLTPRGELLGSSRLVDVVDGDDPAAASTRAKRLQVLQDEHRLFAAAVSRAKHRLVGIGIENTDETPSMLLDLILPPLLRPSSELARPRAMTAPTLLAELRRRLEQHHSAEAPQTTQPQAQEAARALALMASAEDPHGGDRIPGADPEEWWGTVDPREVEPLITEAELDDGAPIRLSPSALDTAFNQPLQWFTQRAGGVAPTDQARSLGLLIHSIAEDHPEPRARPHETQQMLLDALASRWPELGLDPDSWRAAGEYARAQEMIKRIAWYLHAAEESGRKHLISEAHFTTGSQLPVRGTMREVTVSGLIDRLEREVDDAGEPTGRFFILDYKTGRHAPRRCAHHTPPGSSRTKPETCELCGHLQLGIYQTMLTTPAEEKTVVRGEDPVELELTGEVLGAALLQVGEDRKKIEGIEYRQEPITDVDRQDDWPDGVEHWPQLALREAAEVVSGARFRAVHGPGDQQCRVGTLCPLCSSGAEVTQPLE
ncbi:hypothetical protein GCM10027060_20080 [Nesterenkonia halophila]